MKKFLFYFSFLFFAIACENPSATHAANATTASTTDKKELNVKPDANRKPAPKLTEKQTASASTKQNLSAGYWHIGAVVNPAKGENRAYEGAWFKFDKDQRYIYGEGENDLQEGVWLFNEDKEYITFQSETDTMYYLHEFQCRQIGDITILIGNTDNNPVGTQIKLVREGTKIVETN